MPLRRTTAVALKLSELLANYGDDKVQFQNLDECAIDLNYSAKKGTKITFGTEQPVTLKGTKKLGLIVWFDRDRVAEIVAQSKEPHTATAMRELKHGGRNYSGDLPEKE